MKKNIIIWFMLCLSVVASAATTKTGDKELEVLYFNHGDSVSLRWAPLTEATFAKSAKEGYVVQRRKMGEEKWQSISQPLFPLSNEKMAVMELTNDYIEAVREIIYHSGRDTAKYVPETKPGDGTIESVEGEMPFEEAILLAMALYSCDFSLEAARAAAVHFVDKTIEKGARYQYRVVLGSQVSSQTAKVGVCDVNTAQLSVLPKIEGVQATFREDDAFFSWPIESHVGYYSAYMLERGTDSIHFSPVRERPIVHAYTEDKLENTVSYLDSFPNPDDVFYYRLKGLSPFGFWGPPSKVMKGQAKFNFKQVAIHIDTVIYGKKGYADVVWTMDKKFEKKVKGFKIQKTKDFTSFTFLNNELIPAGKRKFRDTKLDRTNYYSVVAYGYKPDEVSNSSFYYGHRADTIPPAVPTGLKGVVDSAGVVRITWHPNKEEDLLGYRLYSSNSGRDDDFYDVTSRYYKDTLFVDTLDLNTLTTNIYYKVLAVDKSYNHSERSKAVKVVKPDTVPPVGVVFEFLTQDDKGVHVKWENSPSEDFAYMELYRQIDDTGKVVLIKRFEAKKKMPTTYVDNYKFQGEVVQYFMTVYDAVGNTTKSRTNRLQTKGERPDCISKVKHVVVSNERNKEIRLTWQREGEVPISRYVVYRKENDGNMLPIASVRSSDLYYTDKQVAIGCTYVYIVRPISTERVCTAVYTEKIEMAGMIK